MNDAEADVGPKVDDVVSGAIENITYDPHPSGVRIIQFNIGNHGTARFGVYAESHLPLMNGQFIQAKIWCFENKTAMLSNIVVRKNNLAGEILFQTKYGRKNS